MTVRPDYFTATKSLTGNVRELRNVLERAVIVSDGRFIDAERLGLRVREHPVPVVQHRPQCHRETSH